MTHINKDIARFRGRGLSLNKSVNQALARAAGAGTAARRAAPRATQSRVPSTAQRAVGTLGGAIAGARQSDAPPIRSSVVNRLSKVKAASQNIAALKKEFGE